MTSLQEKLSSKKGKLESLKSEKKSLQSRLKSQLFLFKRKPLRKLILSWKLKLMLLRLFINLPVTSLLNMINKLFQSLLKLKDIKSKLLNFRSSKSVNVLKTCKVPSRKSSQASTSFNIVATMLQISKSALNVIKFLKLNGSITSVNHTQTLLNKSETRSLNHSKIKLFKFQQLTSSLIFGNKVMDHASKRTLFRRQKTTRLTRLSDLILISHVQANSAVLKQRAVSLKIFLPTQSLLRVTMERIIPLDWVHAQDLKVQEKILFQKSEITSYSKVQKQHPPSICIHAHVIDNFFLLYLFLHFFCIICKSY